MPPSNDEAETVGPSGKDKGFFPNDPTSLSMLDGLRVGDESAWERFVKIFGPMIYGMLRRKGLSEEDARDIGQDVLIKVQKQLNNFDRDGQSLRLRHWLAVVIRSVFLDHVRKQTRALKPVGGSDFHALMEQAPDDWWSGLADNAFEITPEDDSLAIQSTLQLLQPKFSQNAWRSFYGTQIEGRPSREIADELGMKDNAVRQAALRIKRRLAKELEGFIEMEPSEEENGDTN